MFSFNILLKYVVIYKTVYVLIQRQFRIFPHTMDKGDAGNPMINT